MMFDNLYKVMKNYSAYPLLLSSEKVKPGSLLETEWDWFGWGNTPVRFKRDQGCPCHLLKLDPAAFNTKYPTDQSGASIVVGDIAGKVEFGGSLALPQFGFSATASFEQQEIVKFSVGGIYVKSFKMGYADHELRLQLRQLEIDDPIRWPWVNDDFLVANSYHITDLTYEFHEESKLKIDAVLEKLKNTISGGFNLEKANDTTLSLTGTAEAPFAVRGIKI